MWRFAAVGPLLLAGCGGPQSMLGTGNPGGEAIESLWWLALLSMGLLASIVMAALAHAVVRARRNGSPGRGNPLHRSEPRSAPGEDPDSDGERLSREERAILVAGAMVPALYILGFLALAVRTGATASQPPGEPTLTIDVTGHMYWWEIHYPDAGVVTANELHIPAGETVLVRVTSADVIHSFWIPKLSPGKIDMMPGRTSTTWMFAEEPGTYRGQCTEFCGVQHALMSMLVVASPTEEFGRWLERRATPPEFPVDVERRRGLFLFSEHGCDACHSIRGIEPLEGRAAPGPDLTDLADRRTLGALTIDNTDDNLARWISDPHDFKPGVRMPPTSLDERDLAALMAYLTSLRP